METLEIIVIYKTPADFPGKYVARKRFFVDGEWYVKAFPSAVFEELGLVREIIPFGRVRMERHPNDVLSILETWI